MKEDAVRWSAWIPTNRGKIDFNLIRTSAKHLPKPTHQTADKIVFKTLDLSYLSDTIRDASYLIKQPLAREYQATADISFDLDSQQSLIHGELLLSYDDKGTISSHFTIQSTGIVSFSELNSSFDASILPSQQIKNIIYVLVKSIVHGDAHHHQKIDIALPIMDGDFSAEVVSEGLLAYIKLVESNLKRLNSCESMQRNENLVLELEGYLAYFKSFTLLFPEAKTQQHLSFAEQVVKSAKATVDKRKIKQSFSDGFKTAVVTFLGIAISANILLVGLRGQGQVSDIGDLLLGLPHSVEVSIILVLVLLGFFSYINCKFRSWLYYAYYDLFELTKHIKALPINQLKPLGLAVKFIPFLLLLLAVFILWA